MGGQYDNEVDIWSIGVITYVLLCGFTPFYGDNQRQLFERILHAQFDFPAPEWDDISTSAKDFVKKMLVVNPASRLTAGQALAHEWIQKSAPKRELKSFGSVRDGIRNLKAAPARTGGDQAPLPQWGGEKKRKEKTEREKTEREKKRENKRGKKTREEKETGSVCTYVSVYRVVAVCTDGYKVIQSKKKKKKKNGARLGGKEKKKKKKEIELLRATQL